MNSTEMLGYSEPMPLDAQALESALRRLWHDAAQAAGGLPVSRVRALSLIVYTEDAAAAELADAVMGVLPQRHPCRCILVHVDPAADAPLQAAIAARCLLGAQGARKLCSEQITVTAGADTRGQLVDALTPLLVADLPVVLWWTGRPRPADPVFRRFGGLVDRVLLDSAAFRDPAAGVIALARWRDHGLPERRRAVLADLAWERLRPWRWLLAQTVDAPEGRSRLPLIRDVTLAYDGDGAPPEEALLAAGWLTAALGWQPEDSPAVGVVTLRAAAGLVTIRFAPGGSSHDGPLRAIRLRASDGAAFSVRTGGQPGVAVCTAEGDGAPVERAVPWVIHDPAELVVAALGRPGRDPVYDAALAAAAEIAVLGATA